MEYIEQMSVKDVLTLIERRKLNREIMEEKQEIEKSEIDADRKIKSIVDRGLHD